MGTCAWFADVLEYPDESLEARLRHRPAFRDTAEAEADALVGRFSHDASRLGPTALQDAYTSAFDLDPACTLYVGHHLFGEDVRRSLLMSRLAAEYRALAPPVQVDGDLPDRLPAVLRYVDGPIPEDVRRELVEDAMVPALRRLTQALADRGHPYAPLLRALLVTLECEVGRGFPPTGRTPLGGAALRRGSP